MLNEWWKVKGRFASAVGSVTFHKYNYFYSGLQLIASAKLFQIVAGVPYTAGLFFRALIVWFYVVTGGLKASTWVG